MKSKRSIQARAWHAAARWMNNFGLTGYIQGDDRAKAYMEGWRAGYRAAVRDARSSENGTRDV